MWSEFAGKSARKPPRCPGCARPMQLVRRTTRLADCPICSSSSAETVVRGTSRKAIETRRIDSGSSSNDPSIKPIRHWLSRTAFSKRLFGLPSAGNIKPRFCHLEKRWPARARSWRFSPSRSILPRSHNTLLPTTRCILERANDQATTVNRDFSRAISRGYAPQIL